MPTPSTQLPTTCLIGAGSSGIAVVKALKEHGLPFDCFEKSDRVGGNWVFGNKNGMSAAYRDLFINVSRERMEYSDYPMSKAYPDFPHHTQIAEYFDAYVDHFGLRDDITFETGVEHAALAADGTWEVTLDTGPTRRYDMLLVANGHHWDARWPEPAFPGSDSFEGVQMHAHSYVDNSIFEGKNVVILGMGNSAMDIAVESSYVAAKTYLAARRGAWILPKYIFGRPIDQMQNDPRIPFAIRQRAIGALIKAYVGSPERYGLPKPDHRFGEAHPTVSGRILDRIQHGTITPKPNIAALEAIRSASPMAARSTPTSSCTAPATRSASRSLMRICWRRRTTTSSSSAGSSTRTSRTWPSSRCCSRSARSCRSPRLRANGWPTTSRERMRCRRRRICAPTSPTIRRLCASAT